MMVLLGVLVPLFFFKGHLQFHLEQILSKTKRCKQAPFKLSLFSLLRIQIYMNKGEYQTQFELLIYLSYAENCMFHILTCNSAN